MSAYTKPTPEQAFFFSAIQEHRNSAPARRREWDRLARMYRGENDGGEGEALLQQAATALEAATDAEIEVEVNYLYAFVDMLIATVCPHNPKVTVSSPRKALEDAAAFRSALINAVFGIEDMADKIRSAAVRASILPHALLKVVWDERKERPKIRVRTPYSVFFDPYAECWDDLRYIMEVEALTRGQFNARVRRTINGEEVGYYDPEVASRVTGTENHPTWLTTERDAVIKDQESLGVIKDSYAWVEVWEVYDLVGRRFMVFHKDCATPLYEAELPYTHYDNPYVPVCFNDNLRDMSGMSDAQIVAPTIRRLWELASLQMWWLKTTMPIPVIHEGLLDDPAEFEDAYEAVEGPGDYLRMNALARARIEDVLGSTPTPSLPVEWNPMMDNLRGYVEFMLGMPSYARGEVGRADVATELALSDSFTKTRNHRREKVINDAIEGVARRVIGLYQQFMSEDDGLYLDLGDYKGSEVALTRDRMALDGRDSPFSWRYDISAFDGQEDNDVTRLKAMLEAAPLMQENPYVDQKGWAEALLKLFRLGHLLLPEEQAQARIMAAQAAEAAQAGGGAAPPGVPAGAVAPLVGGEVAVGTGAQAVPGGAEGGTIPVA